ncbi:MAG: hypothetical protein PVH19_08285 [Planctomycetia bacterium]|jgi:hypothetical protein
MSETHPKANERKIAQLHSAVTKILAEIMRRGFYGTAGIELKIQDGTIQNIRHRVEQIER